MSLFSAENVTNDHHHYPPFLFSSSTFPENLSTTSISEYDQSISSTLSSGDSISTSSSWGGYVVPGTSLYNDYHYSSSEGIYPDNVGGETHQQQGASNMATSILISTAAIGGPWSRLLTSFIFLTTLFLLALLCFSLALVLMLAFRRFCSNYGGGGRRKRSKEIASVLEDSSSVCLKYSPTSVPATAMNIPPTWLNLTHHPMQIIPPYSTVQQHPQQQNSQHLQQNPQSFPVTGKLTKTLSSSQFYPGKCKEIAAITKKTVHRLSSMTDLTSPSMRPDHIYMDIEASRMTMRSMSTRESSREPMSLPLQLPLKLPLPQPRSVNISQNSTVTSLSPPLITTNSASNNTNTTTSCYITSLEDDHQASDDHASGVERQIASQVGTAISTEQQCTTVYGNVLQHPNNPNIHYYAVSMPWYNAHQQQLLHQQILQHSGIQGPGPMQLNISEANLRNAKASLKTPNHNHHMPLPLPQPLSSLIDPMSASTMMDCYSSYSEVIMELKNKFNNNNNNRVKQKTEENV